MTTKQELLGQLTNAQNNYVLGLAATSLFTEPLALEHLTKSHAVFGTYNVPFDQVSKLLDNRQDREIAVREFLTMLLRALIKESFELIKDYSNDSNQSALLKGEPWFQFARIIRNCISHNFLFEFNAHDRSHLPVSWKGKTITLALDGQPLSLSMFGYVEAWELFSEFKVFAESTLQ
jgi:hypothetical protein